MQLWYENEACRTQLQLQCHSRCATLAEGVSRVWYAQSLLQLYHRAGGTSYVLSSSTAGARLDLDAATDISILPVPSYSCAVGLAVCMQMVTNVTPASHVDNRACGCVHTALQQLMRCITHA